MQLDSISALIDAVDSPTWRATLHKFYDENKALMLTTPASHKLHHCWPGGYHDHIMEVMHNTYQMMALVQDPLVYRRNFTLDEALIAAFIHDLDKLFLRYELDTKPPSAAQIGYASSLGIKNARGESSAGLSHMIDLINSGCKIDYDRVPRHRNKARIAGSDVVDALTLAAKHGFELTPMIIHAVTYHHGGWTKGMGEHDQVEPIAALIHAADLLSAAAQNQRHRDVPIAVTTT